MILGIKGRKNSGKSTVAKYLIKEYGFNEYAFADPLKEALVHIFDFSREQLWGSQEQKETVDPRWGISPRRAMEVVGTDLLQFDIHNHLKDGELPIDRRIWVLRFKIWYEKQIKLTPDMKLLLSDVRFNHEANIIRELGGEIWDVQRPNNPYKGEHLSETEQESIIADRTLLNSSSIVNLETKLDLWMNLLAAYSQKTYDPQQLVYAPYLPIKETPIVSGFESKLIKSKYSVKNTNQIKK